MHKEVEKLLFTFSSTLSPSHQPSSYHRRLIASAQGVRLKGSLVEAALKNPIPLESVCLHVLEVHSQKTWIRTERNKKIDKGNEISLGVLKKII